MYMTDYVKYYMLNFDTITDRRFRKLLVSKKDIYQQRIDMGRVDFSSFIFENIPKDVHILACWYDACRDAFIFIVEHEEFSKVIKGAEFEIVRTKIVDCTRLIKISYIL